MSNMSKATEKEIIKVVKKTIFESLRGVFYDHDQGLEFKDSIKKRLRKTSFSQKGFISLSAARKKYL